MKRLLLSALLLGSGVVIAGDPVSVHPPAAASAPASLNQSLPQVLMQSAPAVSVMPTMSSSPTWTPTPSTWNTATTWNTTSYLNCGKPACETRSCEPKYVAMPGCSPGPSLTRPYVNLLKPPGWLNRCDDGSCHRGNLLERLGAWLGCSRSGHDAPAMSSLAYQAPLRAYFPCQPTAGGASCGTTGTSGPVQGGRLRTVFNPLVNRCDAVPSCDVNGSCAVRPNLLQRMLGFFTPEGFGFTSRHAGYNDRGQCATGACNGLGSSCTTGRVRYANPMTHGTANTTPIQAAPPAPSTYPGTLVPMNPKPTVTPNVMPSSYVKPSKMNSAMQPLTNP